MGKISLFSNKPQNWKYKLSIVMLIIITVLLLLLACCNYHNVRHHSWCFRNPLRWPVGLLRPASTACLPASAFIGSGFISPAARCPDAPAAVSLIESGHVALLFPVPEAMV